MSPDLLAFSFPNPFKLLGVIVSPLLNLGSHIAGGIVETVISGLAGAVVGAVADLTTSVLGFFWDAAEPDLTGAWFYGTDAPYWHMVALSMPLLLAFFLAGVIQGVLKGDVGGMVRMALLRLPGSVLGMGVTVVLADALLEATDDMSASLLAGFRDDVEQVAVVLARLAIGGSLPMMVLILVFGAVGLLAAVVLVVELFVRAALLYLVAVFSPLVYAAAVWEPLRGGVRKLGEVAFALIISKLAIAAALAVSSAALVAAWKGPEPTALPTPEASWAAGEQSASSAVGTLVGAIVIWVIAAFMPFVLWRLLPMAEGAAATHGVRGAPFRNAQMAASAGIMAMSNPATAALKAGAAGGKAAGRKVAGAGDDVAAATRAGESASKRGGGRSSAKGQAGGKSRGRGGSGGGRSAGRRDRSPRGTSGRSGDRPSARNNRRGAPSGSVGPPRRPGQGRQAGGHASSVSGAGHEPGPPETDAGDDMRRHEMGPEW